MFICGKAVIVRDQLMASPVISLRPVCRQVSCSADRLSFQTEISIFLIKGTRKVVLVFVGKVECLGSIPYKEKYY